MRHIFSTFFLIFLFTKPSFSQCADTANIYSFTYNEKKYEVVKEKKTWVNAAACAVERGGYLVEINDVNEQNAVFDAIINGAGVSPTYTSVPNGGGIAYVWIGATDQINEGTWLWDGNNDNLGTHFWTGQGANGMGNGIAVGGAYYNWGGTSTGSPKEPDNYDGQNHAAIGLTGWPSGSTMLGIPGEWNDIIGTSSIYFVIEFESSTGIENQSPIKTKNIGFFPNPASDKITISSGIPIVSVELYNILGERVFSGANSDVNLSAIKRGVYFIKVFDGVDYFIEKVLLR